MATLEETIFQIILHGGNGKSCAMEAISAAKEGNFSLAKEKMMEAAEELNEAHHMQTALIQEEARGNRMDMSLLMVHAQDHLMNAVTLKDMAQEIIDLFTLVQLREIEEK
ncbi:PTS lactose/cellobiose transporter subunit IIA [Niallia sp. 03133]|uniref:PTS lactose/cellobiose transporter subunit IIA n=1 Tax=Niallia sp. 03133 TaxID=3458060 RepID=UPI004044B25B